MKYFLKSAIVFGIITGCIETRAQEQVNVIQNSQQKKIDVLIGGKPFTSFLYPDTLEKPVLYPVHAASGTIVTRGFPIEMRKDEPTDHPHHLGIWFTFENVNGLDFWNNSYAIPAEKKNQYGWIRTDKITSTKSGEKGALSYHANWTNQQKEILLEENTTYEFSGDAHQRIIDRTTVLTANTEVNFTDAKDGLYGIRVAHELQIPTVEDKKYTDDKGNVTVVKGVKDSIANGTYLTSEGKVGDSAWSTRAAWCKMYGRLGSDSVSVIIIDHPKNPNYPTYWHARGYGLFAANPLGEKIFTNGKAETNLHLAKGASVTFKYRIVIHDDLKTLPTEKINGLANEFGRK